MSKARTNLDFPIAKESRQELRLVWQMEDDRE